MDRRERNELIARLRKGGMTHAAIGEKVDLEERQVQRIVRKMEREREEAVLALQREEEARPSDQRDRERAEELVDYLTRSARTALGIARQYEMQLQDAFVLTTATRRLERARVELLEILEALH